MKLIDKIFMVGVVILLPILGCKKLDEKPVLSQVVPETLEDMQGLMDNSVTMNSAYSGLGEISSDSFYITDASYNSDATLSNKNAYIWMRKTFEGVTVTSDWDGNYSRVFYSNVVLDGLNNLDRTISPDEYKNVKGQALFLRAYAFFLVAQEFTKPYNESTAATDLGIPLRLISDLNIPSKRASLKETYDRIIDDLLEAKVNLPNASLYKTRASKAAAFGLLSRVYLSKGDFKNAYLNADSCLKLNQALINYNSLNTTTAFPFTLYNSEVIFHATMTNTSMLIQSRLIVNPTLYQQYSSNDLRKSLFFKDNGNGTYAFKGSYNGAGNPLFCGITTDEMYLVRAECNARLGSTADALADINSLLITRYKTGSYVPITVNSADDALTKILSERRKELMLRGLRWSDLRRLNADPRFATTLTRTVAGIVYTLPPNDSRYTFPIPDYVIALGGIEQNPEAVISDIK